MPAGGIDAAAIQDKIYYGYGKVAEKLGTSFDYYRAPDAIDPLDIGNKIGSIKASVVDVSGNYDVPDKYGASTWRMYVDGRQTELFDYFVSTDPLLLNSTYYIVSMHPIIPILIVECNRTVTIKRPTQPSGVGSVGYGGYLDSTSTVLAQGLPVSMLQGNKGSKNPVMLPTDTKLPWFTTLVPALPGLLIQTGDIITTENSEQYIVGASELTELGYRLNVNELGA